LYGIAVTLNHGSMGYTYEAGEEAVHIQGSLKTFPRLRGVQSAILADSSMRPRKLFVRQIGDFDSLVRDAHAGNDLTTTLSELNRLYGEYFGATEGGNPDVQKAVRAWVAYEQYARLYNRERGLASVSPCSSKA